MITFLILAGAIIAGAGALPYILAVLRGTVHPRLVSWGVWAVLSGIMALSSFMEGQAASAVLSLEAFASCTAIVILGWRQRSLSINKLDIACMVGAVLGILSLIIFRDPTQALIVSVIVDAVAFIPTLFHAWTHPDEESLACFLLTSAGGVLALIAAIQVGAGLVGLLYPAYSVAFNGVMALLLVIGRMGPLLGYRYDGKEA